MNQTLNLTFGQCVRALRQEKGLTQVVFSERCGFYQTYLSRIENGQANPTLNAIEVIATGLGLTIFALFERVRQRVEPAAVAAEVASEPEVAPEAEAAPEAQATPVAVVDAASTGTAATAPAPAEVAAANE